MRSKLSRNIQLVGPGIDGENPRGGNRHDVRSHMPALCRARIFVVHVGELSSSQRVWPWFAGRHRQGLSGAEAAQTLLDSEGIGDVRVGPTRGYVSDHYNPTTKELALSENIFAGRSIAAVGIAVHEVGHAWQYATNYAPLGRRSALVPTTGIGSSIGYVVLALGLFIHPYVALAGVINFFGRSAVSNHHVAGRD